MSFLPKPEPDEDESLQLFEEDEMETDPARHTDNKLQTNHSSTELQSRLHKTHNIAQITIGEQGVNTLYLALGMLQWYESKSSDLLRRAPLILIPVEIDVLVSELVSVLATQERISGQICPFRRD